MSARIIKEDVDPRDIHPRDLTNDCYYVYRKDGQVDIARGTMVRIFDTYHDLRIILVKIKHAEGRLNPKFQEPRL